MKPTSRFLHLSWPLALFIFIPAIAGTVHGDVKSHLNMDCRVNPPKELPAMANAKAKAATMAAHQKKIAADLQKGLAHLKTKARGAEATYSPETGSVEVVSAADALTEAVPGRAGFDIVKDFLRDNAPLYGLSATDIANLHFIGESVSQASGLRMVRVEQMVNGHPVFQSETRFTLDRNGRIIRSVGLLIPDATGTAAAPTTTVTPQGALVSAMRSVDLVLNPDRMTLANTKPDGSKTEVVSNDPQVTRNVPSELVYFPIAPGVLVLAWSQVSFTKGEGDWYTLVDANTGDVLWRKNIRSHASSQEAKFSVYVQADGKTPADSPAPLSPTTATPGSNTQPPAIARTTVNMSAVQNPTASPDGWISDGVTTTTGNNVDAYLDRNVGSAPNYIDSDVPDTDVGGVLDGNGRPTGNPDAAARNRDFLGTTPRNYTMLPSPQAGNPESGQTATGAGNNGKKAIDAFRRGSVTHLFYISNWYHDQLHALGFDAAAGNFQTNNFGEGGNGNDAVLAECQDGLGTDNANFSTPPDGESGRMQMYIFDGPSVDRDGSLDAEIVIHELTHGLSNRLIGNGAGLNWDVGGGMGEGWSDFYALSLLNNINADSPNANYAAGAYATYKLGGLTDNYLYGIRRFPYSTNNAINPLTWADVDDVTNNIGGGIAASPLDFNGNGGCEVHNIGEIWCNTLWEVRSRVIADPAFANGDVPTGNNRMLQIVTDAMKMTPANPSFIDARDALIAADAATNAGANEKWIWQGFADRGLGYKAVAPYSRMYSGHVSIGESTDLPYLDMQSVAIDDSLGNNNGALDSNEPVRLTVKLKNPWRNDSFGVASATATLTSSTAGVTIVTNNSTYPTIPALGNADGSKFQILTPAGATAGQPLAFTITVNSSLGTKAVNFTVRVGTSAGNGAPVTYSKASVLNIPDNAPGGVTNTLTIADDLEIADLNFRVDSLTHTFPGDLTTLVRAPNGLGTDLIGLLGGGVDGGGAGDNFTNTVIDDQAAADLLMAPNTAAPYTGSWKPIYNNASWNNFGFPTDPTGALSRYNGLSTKGDWKILVADSYSADTGTLNSWSLIVTPKAYIVTAFSDTTPPTVAVTPNGTTASTAPITFTLTFSEQMNGLTESGINVTNGTKGALSGSGTTYTLPVTPTAPGTVTCQVAAGAAKDPSLNNNTESNLASVQMLPPREAWRQQYFGSTTNTDIAADNADPDGDGCSNQLEYVAGLLPNDATSHFNIAEQPVTGQPEQKAITFSPLVAGRSYEVKSSTTLTEFSWAALINFTTSDTGNVRTVTDLSADSDKKFYRVEITAP